MQGSGPNAFAALVGLPSLPAPGPAPSSVAALGSLGHQSSGIPGSSGGGWALGSPAAATAAGLTSLAVAHSAPAVVTVSAAPAATPLICAPSAASRGATAPSPEACATIGPEIRAAAAADPAVTGTLAAAAAAALHCEGDVPHVMLPPLESAEASDAADLAYALPRALWPPAPVAVAAQQGPPSAAEAEQQPRPPQSDEAEAVQAIAVTGVAAAVGSEKVTPQMQTFTQCHALRCTKDWKATSAVAVCAKPLSVQNDRSLVRINVICSHAVTLSRMHHMRKAACCHYCMHSTENNSQPCAGVSEHVGGDAHAGRRPAGAAA